MAWVNAEDADGVLAGLAAVAAALGWMRRGDAQAAGRAVRHWLEAGGERCLLVFDNATDPAAAAAVHPGGGSSPGDHHQQRAVDGGPGRGRAGGCVHRGRGAGVPGRADRVGRCAGARELAAELGYLPLALAQAAAVIAGQHLSYGTYLDRLRRLPVRSCWPPVEAGQYPRGVAAAVLLSLERVRAGDDSGTCVAVMDLLAVLSPPGSAGH